VFLTSSNSYFIKINTQNNGAIERRVKLDNFDNNNVLHFPSSVWNQAGNKRVIKLG